MDIKHGSFVISLDFEMMWGVKDICTPDEYGQTNVKNVREVIDRMLALFERYGAKATFATVGLLMFQDKREALKYLPKQQPQYVNPALSPFEDKYIENIEDRYSRLYFAPDIVDKLRKSANIEIASHTFSHYNCWAEGQTLAQFEQDVQAQIDAMNLIGCGTPKSIVFPRNQVSPEYVELCKQFGIESYRGNPKRFYANSANCIMRGVRRLLRLLDCYVEIDRTTTVDYSSISNDSNITNIPASRFLRPYSKRLGVLEPLKLRRIKKEMLRAARNGELYHIWWHPHNFGSNVEENMANLEVILAFYADCRKQYGMQSYTMSEFNKLITR